MGSYSTPTDAEVEAVAEGLALADGFDLSGLRSYASGGQQVAIDELARYRKRARAAIIALDEVRGRG